MGDATGTSPGPARARGRPRRRRRSARRRRSSSPRGRPGAWPPRGARSRPRRGRRRTRWSDSRTAAIASFTAANRSRRRGAAVLDGVLPPALGVVVPGGGGEHARSGRAGAPHPARARRLVRRGRVRELVGHRAGRRTGPARRAPAPTGPRPTRARTWRAGRRGARRGSSTAYTRPATGGRISASASSSTTWSSSGAPSTRTRSGRSSSRACATDRAEPGPWCRMPSTSTVAVMRAQPSSRQAW